MKPIMKVPQEEYNRMMEEKLKEKLEPLDKEIAGFKERLEKSSSAGSAGVGVDITKIDSEVVKVKPITVKPAVVASTVHPSHIESSSGIIGEDDGILCPTCHKGHVHKLGIDGITATCTDCGKKSYISPEDADHMCTTCGLAFKKPEEGSKFKIDECPRCKNVSAQAFNLEDLKRRDRNRRVR